MKVTPRISQKLLASLLVLAAMMPLSAQAHRSSQAHEERVTALLPLESSSIGGDDFFSAGGDGFLVKWNTDGTGDHYQLSDLEIRLVAKNPGNDDVAIYETDGVSVHRVSVWNWKSFTRKYAKRFTDSVTALSYSEKGTSLFVCTSAVNGLYVLNAQSGSVAKRLNTSVVSALRTASSEKSVLMYSPGGSILYYSMKTWQQLHKFATEAALGQTLIFGSGEYKNRFLAGVKDNTVYVVDATSGKTVAQYAASSPFIFSSRAPDEKGLYYTTFDGRNYELRLVTNEELYERLNSQSASLEAPQAPAVVKRFTGIPGSDSFTAAAKNNRTVMLGTASGNIYTMTDVPESELHGLLSLTEKMYDRIFDINCDGSDFYFLTQTALFRSSYDKGSPEMLGTNPAHKNLIRYKDSAILWTRGTKKAVQELSLANGNEAPATLFTPKNTVQRLSLFGSKLVCVQGNTSVGIYDLETRTYSDVYSGTSVQDAILTENTELYVAKTDMSDTDTPLLCVNPATGETVPVSMGGNVVFSLSYESRHKGDSFYGIVITPQGGNQVTKVFSFSIKERKATTLLQIAYEDPTAFTVLGGRYLFTNLGQTQVYAINTSTLRSVKYNRSASIPQKIQSTETRTAILNRDGSLSWYSPENPSLLADWYLTMDGRWFTF